MLDLPSLILLAIAILGVVGVIECLRSVAVMIRDETAIHDLMVDSAQAKIDHMAANPNDREVVGVDIVGP